MIRRFIITFPTGQSEHSLTYDLIKKFDVRINILKADIDVGRSGTLLVEFDAPEQMITDSLQYIKQYGNSVSAIGDRITRDGDKCIDCGACTSSCLPGALTIGAPDWKLQFDPDKCIVCKHCIKACPLQLFHVEFGED